jgi:uncharacterized protein
MRRRAVMVELKVVEVRRQKNGTKQGGRCFVLLEEAEGTRRLRIWLGQLEATALALQLEKASFPRPLTYAFTGNVFQNAGGRLRGVRINHLVGDIYYATTVVVGPVGDREVDARPSDALSLALLMEAPIWVSNDILEARGFDRGDEEWRNDEEHNWQVNTVAMITADWISAADKLS